MPGLAERPAALRPPLRVLLHPPGHRGIGWSTVASLAIHAALLALVLLAYHDRPERRNLVDEFVTFLVPPNEKAGAEDSRSVPWSDMTGTGPGGTATTEAPAPEASESPIAALDSPGPLPAIGQIPELGDSVLTEIQVDSAVRRFPESAAPEYPLSQLQANIEGYAHVRFVVDTTGLADLTSFEVVEASHSAFAMAVRRALPDMRFRAAILGGRKVRQLVQQTFTFRIQRNRDTVPPIVPETVTTIIIPRGAGHGDG